MNEELTMQGATVEGTSESDNFTLSSSDITLTSGAGDDTIEVMTSGNVINAGAGSNVVHVLSDGNSVTLGDGANTIMPLASGVTVRAGDGANFIRYAGTDNVIRLGDGGNTVRALYYDSDAEVQPFVDDNARARIVTGTGADMIYARNDGNTVSAGAGNDTIVVEGNGNRLYGGHNSSAATLLTGLSDDNLMTVRGNDNTVTGGAGANVVVLEGRSNLYEGAGLDTLRAEVDNSTLTGGTDVTLEGDDNYVTMYGGRLIFDGNRSELVLEESEGTLTGNQMAFSAINSRATVSGEEFSAAAYQSTIEATTLTSGDFYVDRDAVYNGRRYVGDAILHMTNGSVTSAEALSYMFGGLPTTLSGFEGIPVRMRYNLTMDGIDYEVFTVPSGSKARCAVTVQDKSITDLGLGEGLKVSEAGLYTVNGSQFELTADDTIVGTNDWAGKLALNFEDNVTFEGTSYNDRLNNYGAGATVDGGLGVDHITLGSAAREFVVFDEDSTLEVEGFATGFDSVSDVLINDGDRRDFRFDFGLTGVHITQNEAEIDLINSGDERVDFLLQNGDDLIKFTAVNGGATTAGGEADYYALNDGATLYAGDGSFVVNGVDLPDDYLSGATVIGSSVSTDYEFTEFVLDSPLVGTYTVHGISYDTVLESVEGAGQFFVFDGDATVNNYSGEGFFNALHFATDGRATVEIVEGAPIDNAYKSVKSITGVSAGDHFTVGSMINGEYFDHAYTVSADGTAILDDGGVAWSGTKLAALNLMDIYDQDAFEERLRDLLLPIFRENVTVDEAGLRINLAGFRQVISARIGEFTEQLRAVENPTADDVIAVLDEYLTDKFGLALSDVLNEATIERLKTRLATRIADGADVAEQAFESIEAAGVMNFVHQRVLEPIYENCGTQVTGSKLTALLKGESTLVSGLVTEFLLPNVAANDRVLRLSSAIYNDLVDSLRSNWSAAKRTDGRIELILEGTSDTARAGIYATDDAGLIDASKETGAAWIFNADGGNVSIEGSAQRDLIIAGANNTIDAGAGADDYIVLASGESTVYVSDGAPTTIGVIADVFDAYISGTRFEDNHTREYVVLSSVSDADVFGFEAGFKATDDVIMVDGDVTALEFKFNEFNDVDVFDGAGVIRLIGTASMTSGSVTSTSRTPHSDVSVDVMLRADSELIKATAINDGKSAVATGADRYYVGEGSSLTGMTAGEEFTIVDGDGAINYSVSGDGTSIIRTGDDQLMWTGLASELAAVNVLDLEEIPSDDTTSETPIDDTTSEIPVDDTTSETPVDDTTSEIPVDDTTSGFGIEDTTSVINGDVLITLSSGERNTLNVVSGDVTVVGYDVTTRSAFAVDGVSTFDGNGFAGADYSVKLEGDHSNGFFAAIIEDGDRQIYGWNDAEGVIDGSSFAQPLQVISNGWSTVIGGSRSDTIQATGGDIITLSRGHDLITIDDRMKGEVMIDLGTHLTHTTVEGFVDDVVKVEDVNALKVKVTDYGMRLRAGNAFLTLAGVEDTVRISDGENEFILRTDYRDMLPDVDYVLEDADRIVRTPDGALTIDDDIFIFKGGADLAINGFDDRWQLQAGDGIEVERVTTLVNGTVKYTTNNGSLKLRK